MDFFNECWAATVQKYSLGLEALGLLLAFIELKEPGKARAIEDWLDGIPREIERIRDLVLDFIIGESLLVKVGTYLVYGVVLLITLTAILASAGGPIFQYREFWTAIITGVKIVAISGGVVLAVLILVSALNNTIHFLDDYSDGRALGALGVVLALTGVIGEVYQVITLRLGPAACG